MLLRLISFTYIKNSTPGEIKRIAPILKVKNDLIRKQDQSKAISQKKKAEECPSAFFLFHIYFIYDAPEILLEFF